mgnify:CR=1 FL=1
MNPNPPDISAVLGQITGLLDESIAGLAIREDGPPAIARYGPQASVSQESVEPVWALLREQESRQADRELPADALKGKIVISASNYYPERDGHIAELDNESTVPGISEADFQEQARKAKEASGRATDDPGLESEGKMDQSKADLKQALA